MLQVRRIDGEPVSLRIGEREFEVEEETGYVTVPKEFLTGSRLSDMPEDISIKPVEKIEGHTIHVQNDVALSQFTGGLASAVVEDMFRRKFWDGHTGLSPYVAALRQAIDEVDEAAETDFQDDGDYIFVHYEITMTEDLRIQDAIHFVDATIERIQERADQLVSRRLDGLTGIFDRSSFDRDLSWSVSGNHPVALLIADVDHFKKVNDTYGHPAGDEVLRAVAKVLASKCGNRNLVAYRYGGEELALIITGEPARRAAEIAESIRTDVEQLRLEAMPDLEVTVSVGLTAALDAERDGTKLVRRADAALYRAKQEGRNRVIPGK